jgi:serine/threonine protein kinase
MLLTRMAPEVIQETSYDGKADIWSLGITLLELCEGSPPYFSVHPMRAIFMISAKPAPTLKEPEKWSSEMQDFVSKCLMKDSELRASSAELLKHPWIRQSVREIGSLGNGLPVLENLIEKYWESMERARASRFKLPENLAAGLDGNGEIAAVNEENLSNEDNMATMRSNGIPATRQQIRNASLSRSLSSTMLRSRSNSAAPQRNPMMFNNDNMGTLIRSNSHGITPGYYDSSYKYDDDYAGTLVRKRNDVQNEEDYSGTLVMKRPIDGNGTLVSPSQIKVGTFQKTMDHKDSPNNKQELQAALKYFRDDPLPPIPDAKVIAERAERKTSKSELSITINNDDDKNRTLVRPPIPVLQQDDQLAYETEVAILDQMTNMDYNYKPEDETVEALKKVSEIAASLFTGVYFFLLFRK